MTLGENIKMIRESKYMSILDLQEITGLSKSTIKQLERDILNPTLDIKTLGKVAHALDMTIDELLLTKKTDKINIQPKTINKVKKDRSLVLASVLGAVSGVAMACIAAAKSNIGKDLINNIKKKYQKL